MLTGQPPAPPPAPASLPPAKRRPKRINRLPALGFLLLAVIFGAVGIYTFYLRGEASRRQREGLAPPASADASGYLKDKGSGFINATKYQTMALEHGAAPPPKAKEPEVKEEPKDDNGLEQARKQAWVRHWKEYNDLRDDRFKKRHEALAAADTAVKVPGAGGGAGEAAEAATPAAASVPASGGSHNGFGGGFGGGGGGWGNGYSGFNGWPGIQTPQIDREGQEQKLQFAGQQGDLGKNDVVPTRRKPADPLNVIAGSFVKFTTMNTVNSDVPGSTIGRVTESVYNNDGSCILIPQNAVLMGHYNSVVSNGQDRLPGVLTRINFPDGSHQSIGAMEMADNAGSAGLEDQVNRHLPQKFGGAALAGAFGAGIYLAVPHNNGFNNGYDATSIIGASLAQQIGQVGQQISLQALAIPNTVTIRAGMNGTMITDRDIHISPPWSCNGQRRSPILPIMSVN